MEYIFSDDNLSIPILNKILYEGLTYYIDVSGVSSQRLENWLIQEYVLDYILNFHRKNLILILRFNNIVGYVNILGILYDVRSSKLLDSISGKDQFGSMLDEINSISSRLTFNLRGTAKANRSSKAELSLNIFETFDYYYQLVFLFPRTSNLDALLEQCFNNPCLTYETKKELVNTSKVGRIPNDFYRQIYKIKDYVALNEHNSLTKTSFAKLTIEKFNKQVFPAKINGIRTTEKHDNNENKFVKFVLEEMLSTGLLIINSNSHFDVKEKAKLFIQKVQKLLILPFFLKISRLKFIPATSTILINKKGYKELYYHYVKSKQSFNSLLDDLNRQGHKSGLKNIAMLYEVWVFFKIAEQVFKDKVIHENFVSSINGKDSISQKYSWQSSNIELFFNKTYTHLANGSYSINLRPDVSLLLYGSELYIFDAKYKFEIGGFAKDEKTVKSQDIHKMHTYIDALNAKTAIVVYPGNEYVFYDKTNKTVNLSEVITGLRGVGAIPLTPMTTNIELIIALNL